MAIDTHWLSFGDGYTGYAARPPSADPLPAVLVIQEAWGVDAHIEDLCGRFARAGYFAFAPDLFQKSGARPPALGKERMAELQAFINALPPGAWMDPKAREAALVRYPKDEAARIGESLGAMMTQVTNLAQHLPVLLAATEFLRQQPATKGQKVGSVGFCMGGGCSALLACHDPKLAAAAIFYGHAPPAEQVAKLSCPVIGFYGATDARINEGISAFSSAAPAARQELRAADSARGGARLLQRQPAHLPRLRGARVVGAAARLLPAVARVSDASTGSSAPWTPEKVVDLSLARALITRQFPTLGALPVKPFGEGFDNTAYLVGEEWVFRFPRRQVAVPLIEAESRLLPAIARRLPWRVPVPEFVGDPSDEFPWPFLGYKRLPGRTADRLALSDAQRTALAAPLGRFLKALHSISAEEAASFGAGPDLIGKVDVPLRTRRTHEALEKLRPLGVLPPGLEAAMLKVLDQAASRQGRPSLKDTVPRVERVLLHGDLYARHLLLDDALQVSGVIDWGDICFGHRATDLGGAVALLPPAALPAMLEAYGGCGEADLELARFRAVTHQVWILLFAADRKDEPLAKESLGALVRACTAP